MNNVSEVKKAFRAARIAGEQMLSHGRITWDDFSNTMRGYEIELEGMGVDL
ncbi:hypothetical protein ANME2D_00536 [Candidatus Methanoperedens nitroreducens]|uniref:Uncharacterized protein n=1 Tax=Candidatus Methanoperedens nitratireducens TaxID=1392998 RepID=A0A062VAG4_9EURY|nr:hypothetical protein [Candidatus Methanoperedens nitroreducens]KCZ73468.1 hypothetical protein ANME2D_00536 [Candidatus Methanoperedens nitroreducens]MDJ1422575.1 hypothetical protein [Candidatus Methanoperedens sp.]